MTPGEYRAAIVDLDGTVYRGDRLVPGADRGIETLREAGVDVLFLSNKAIERRATYAEKLDGLGVEATPDEVINSGWVTAEYVAEHHPEREAFVIGEHPLVEELRRAGVEASLDRPGDLLIASMDREFSYEKLELALETLADGGPFLATNPDRTCPTEDGAIPDAAGMIGAVEGVTGRDVDAVLGKPSETTVRAAMAEVDADPADCLMIGDRLETDIEMGERAGMTTVLVLSGVTDRADLDGAAQQPDYVVETLGDVEHVLQG